MARLSKKELAAMGTPITEAKVKPHKHPSFLLGTFDSVNPPKGFTIAIHPDPNPVDSVTTSVTRSGSDDCYKLILHVTNNSAKPIGVRVHQLV
jgi:hypothetical protein